MRRLILTAGVTMLIANVGILPPRADVHAKAQVSDDGRIVADFQARIERYVELHRRLEGTVPTIRVSDDWTATRAAIDALAAKIRAARKNARRGEIFTPEIERWFRRQVAACLEGCNTDQLLAALNEETPKRLILVPHLNAQWPERASLGPMPPQVLAGLPPLPEELHYRFMNRDLVLWDAHANIIVDFIERAMP